MDNLAAAAFAVHCKTTIDVLHRSSFLLQRSASMTPHCRARPVPDPPRRYLSAGARVCRCGAACGTIQTTYGTHASMNQVT